MIGVEARPMIATPVEAGAPLSLAQLPCRCCGQLGARVVAFAGPFVLAWCSADHAAIEGWPFLAKEAQRAGGRIR